MPSQQASFLIASPFGSRNRLSGAQAPAANILTNGSLRLMTYTAYSETQLKWSSLYQRGVVLRLTIYLYQTERSK